MTRQLNVKAASAALTLTLIVAACATGTASHNEVPTPGITATERPTVTSTTRPTNPLPTATPSPTPRPTENADVPIVDSLWEWTEMTGLSEDIMPPYAFDGKTLVWEEFGDQIEGERWTLRLMARVGDETWEFYQSALGWLPNDVFVAEGRIVFVEFENERGDYNLWVYDVQTRERSLIEEWAGEPYRHQVPLLSLDGHRLAWSTTLRDGRSCIRVRDLAEGTQFDAICSADELTVLDWPYLRWPLLTYQAEQAEAPDFERSCRTMYTLRLPDGEPQAHEVTRCYGFQGAADERVVVWTEMRSGDPTPWHVPVYAEGADGQVVRLGVGCAGTVVVCDGRAYWKTEFGNRPTEIRSWVPGGAVEVIYRSPDVEECAGENDYSVTTPLCHSDLVLIGRHGCQADATEEILVARMP